MASRLRRYHTWGAWGAAARRAPSCTATSSSVRWVVHGDPSGTSPIVPAAAGETLAPRSCLMHKQEARPGWPDLLTGLEWRARDGGDDAKGVSSYAATLQLQAQSDLCWTDDSVADAILGHAPASLPAPCSAAMAGEGTRREPLLHSSHSFPSSPRYVCCCVRCFRSAQLLPLRRRTRESVRLRLCGAAAARLVP